MVDTQELKNHCKNCDGTQDVEARYTDDGCYCAQCNRQILDYTGTDSYKIRALEGQIESLSLQLSETTEALKQAVNRQGFTTEELINARKILQRK